MSSFHSGRHATAGTLNIEQNVLIVATNRFRRTRSQALKPLSHSLSNESPCNPCGVPYFILVHFRSIREVCPRAVHLGTEAAEHEQERFRREKGIIETEVGACL